MKTDTRARQQLAKRWPAHFAREISTPQSTLWQNLETAVLRHGEHCAIHYFGTDISYRRLLNEAEAFAAWLQHSAGIRRGDRVLLHMQNCPQWVAAYYGALRADAVVVPSNPMNSHKEIHHGLASSGAKIVVCADNEVNKIVEAARSTDVSRIVTVSYSAYLPQQVDFDLPAWIVEPPAARAASGCEPWSRVLSEASGSVTPALSSSEDLCLLLYTSGSTGPAKGCMHTHRSLMHVAAGLSWWHSLTPGAVCLGVSPMSHIGGINHCINAAAYAGASVVLLPRWQRELAAALVARYRIGQMGIAPTAIIDLLSDPQLPQRDLSSLRRIVSAGAPISDAVLKQVQEQLGVPVIQSYGLSETAGATHSNPFDAPKNCLGIPFFNTQAVIVDPATREILGEGQAGEIAVRGPQLFSGYWESPQATQAAFADTEEGRFFLTGDIGHCDADGYFWMRDRLKRMINASGFKVSPTEVEGILHEHPAVKEACVVGIADAYRGESVKAYVVLKKAYEGQIAPSDIIEWSRGQMAAYKYPRAIEFLEDLPKSSFGKVLWQQLQQRGKA